MRLPHRKAERSMMDRDREAERSVMPELCPRPLQLRTYRQARASDLSDECRELRRVLRANIATRLRQ
jgi:hypothetical protein